VCSTIMKVLEGHTACSLCAVSGMEVLLCFPSDHAQRNSPAHSEGCKQSTRTCVLWSICPFWRSWDGQFGEGSCERCRLRFVFYFVIRSDSLSLQISALPDLCCIVTRRLVWAVGCIPNSHGHATSLFGVQQSLGVTSSLTYAYSFFRVGVTCCLK